jgi:serine/threonine protein kinase
VIFDFGSACILGDDCKTYQFHGTRAYASPASLQLLSSFPAPYEYSSHDDTYSVGIIMKKDMQTLVAQEDLLGFEIILQELGF